MSSQILSNTKIIGWLFFTLASAIVTVTLYASNVANTADRAIEHSLENKEDIENSRAESKALIEQNRRGIEELKDQVGEINTDVKVFKAESKSRDERLYDLLERLLKNTEDEK